MEWFKAFKEKQRQQRYNDIINQAESLITLSDFEDKLYVAYDGTTLIPIDPSWTTKEIVQQLSTLRQNYINSRMKENGLTEEEELS